MKHLSSSDLQFYRKNGYVVVHGAVQEELIHDLFRTTLAVFKKYQPRANKKIFRAKGWTDELFHRAMIELRKQNPRMFGMLYDTVQTSVSLQRLMNDQQVLALAGALLTDGYTNLSVTSYMLRMDVPFDTRNNLDWHQDSSYFIQNLKGENGVVCWIPMQDISAKNGAVKLCVGSQKEGLLRSKKSKKTDNFVSDQYKVPNRYLKKYNIVDVKAEVGEATFFNMDLIHRSGVNSTDHIRFTAGARYHRMLTPDFLPGRFAYVPNEFVKAQRERRNTS
jgi:ectoine hydroxylase-related dioxygenase (phytanoyl-CoA dioxygenase family)